MKVLLSIAMLLQLNANNQIAWDLGPDIPTVARALALVPRLRVDGGSPMDLTGVTCSEKAKVISCQAKIPAALIPLANIAGTRKLTLRLYDPVEKIESPDSTALSILMPIGAPANVQLIASARLAVKPTAIANQVNLEWSSLPSPAPLDWIALAAASAPNNAWIDWVYVNCMKTQTVGRAAGSCTFTLPANLAPGAYQFRILANAGFNVIAASPAFIVGTT